MDIGSIASAATSLKSIADLAKSLGDIKSISDAQSLSIKLREKIIRRVNGVRVKLN